MKLGLLMLMFVGAAFAAGAENYFVYVGTYTDSGSKGIYGFRFNATTGSATPVGLVAETENPSYLAVDPQYRFLYATNEVEKFEGRSDGSISVYAIDRRSGKLNFLQRVPSGGWGPVYLSFDKNRQVSVRR